MNYLFVVVVVVVIFVIAVLVINKALLAFFSSYSKEIKIKALSSYVVRVIAIGRYWSVL
jgi:hypothetical protein